MNKTMMAFAAAAFTAILAGSTSAQDEPKGKRPGGNQPGQGRGGMMGGGFGGNVYGMLANNKALQEELKISEEQIKKLGDVSKEMQTKMREAFTGGGFGREATEEQRKEMREKFEKLTAESKKAFEAVLTSEQVKRASQINYQVMGVRAFSDKDVQTNLKISDDQKETIKGIMDEYQKDMRELFGAGRGEDNTKKMEALRKEVEEKVASKLTDEQKKAWKEMIGEKFDTAKLRQAPPRSRDN